MRLWLLSLIAVAVAVAVAVASPAAGQVWPGYPAANQADIHRYRLEQQRLQSAEQAAFARQQSLSSRLTRLEVEAARQPQPHVPLVEPVPSPRGMATPSVAGSTARREAVSAGVGQIDTWLDRDPR